MFPALVLGFCHWNCLFPGKEENYKSSDWVTAQNSNGDLKTSLFEGLFTCMAACVAPRLLMCGKMNLTKTMSKNTVEEPLDSKIYRVRIANDFKSYFLAGIHGQETW